MRVVSPVGRGKGGREAAKEGCAPPTLNAPCPTPKRSKFVTGKTLPEHGQEKALARHPDRVLVTQQRALT
jgi:hypothetical protein